jgi:hypothetical protein
MSSIIVFNGTEYDLTKIHTQAALGHDIEINRRDVVLNAGDVVGEEVQPPVMNWDSLTADTTPERTVAVYRYFGRYYIMQGLMRAVDDFAKRDTIKAKLISKHMLKKCECGYVGGKIVVEAPEPRRYGSYRDDAPRSTYNRNTRDR